MLYLVETEKNVILLRNARGLSQGQAALEAGISPGRWQQLEKGSKIPPWIPCGAWQRWCMLPRR